LKEFRIETFDEEVGPRFKKFPTAMGRIETKRSSRQVREAHNDCDLDLEIGLQRRWDKERLKRPKGPC
jgi:hypothetical protein